MLFNSLRFAVFFAALWVVYRAVPRRARTGLLLGASLLFYTFWVPAYTLLLLADVGVNYALLRAMRRAARPRVYLVTSLVFTFGLLANFKYAAFLVTNVAPMVEFVSGVSLAVPDFFLPLGISFYSFQIAALAIDVYRGDIEAPRSLARYALFISFFPQLIAGPILRGRELLPQLERGGQMSADRTRRGLWLLVWGLVKKVIFADFLLAPFVDPVFAAAGVARGPIVLVAVYSFAFQIYFDFSGYTDMARGLGCLLGFELPKNFREPYLSRNPLEFWRRWHITLSRWLRDYLYIPLGGNRRGRPRVYVNLMITMLLGGLWHGASWTFVLWGGIHGLWLVLHRITTSRRVDDETPLAWSDAPRVVLSFHMVCLLWVFFRAPDVASAGLLLKGLLKGSWSGGWPVIQAAVVALCASFHGVERFVEARAGQLREYISPAWGGVVEGAVFGLVAGLVWTIGGSDAEFIYFQF